MHPYSRFAGLPPNGEASFKPAALPSANLRSYEIETETEIEDTGLRQGVTKVAEMTEVAEGTVAALVKGG